MLAPRICSIETNSFLLYSTGALFLLISVVAKARIGVR